MEVALCALSCALPTSGDLKTKPSVIAITETTSTYSKNSLFMSPTTPEEIANVITSLINKKAIRSKDIETYFIKISGVIIASILSKLFNQCLLEGEFPKCLKIAEVIPIFKKGSATNVSNYRPISLLSQFDKFLKKLFTIEF